MRLRYTALAAATLLGALACTNDSTAPGSARPNFSAVNAGPKTYVIQTNGNSVPDGLSAAITAAGGTVTASLGGIGVVIATSDAADFGTQAGRISGVGSVVEDQVVQFQDPQASDFTMDAGEAGVGDAVHAIGGHETFRLIQWAPDAVSAPAAWATGAMGAGARVAILDGGIRSTHIDIAPNLDVAHSASFVPGQAFNTDVGTFWHGTHVAGIVAAPANSIGTVGIAPNATIVGVKVLHNGSGAFSWVIQGIYYAATPIAEGGAGAHIINMSLGAGLVRQGRDVAELMNAVSRATTYAYQRGTLVLAAAGNSGVDIDHTANFVFTPAQNTNVVTISATGPEGFALGATNFDDPASYTNYGQSAITLAGPGGDSRLPGSALCTLPRLPTGSVTAPCWVFDLVMAPCRGGGTSNSTYCWAAGTSMATPAAAGVAALVVGKYGPMHPAQLEAILRQSADDLGKPGNDDFYGRGRVNALRAVQ